MFCYQAAALRRARGTGQPDHVRQPRRHRRGDAARHPRGGRVARCADVLADSTLARNAVPAWMSRLGFRMLDPVKAARQQVDFLRQLHDREALLPRERQRRFLQAEGWVAWPGPALADFMRQFIAHNRMLEGGFVIDERLVTLADIDCPILTVVGEVDEIAPAPAVRAIVRAAPRAEVYELALQRRALRPGRRLGVDRDHLADRRRLDALARRGRASCPTQIRRIRGRRRAGRAAPARAPAPATAWGSRPASARTWHARSSAASPARPASMRTLGEEAVTQLPRLIRLDQVRPRTRISLGKLLDEQADDTPRPGLLPVRGPRPHPRRRQAPHRLDRPRPDLGRRPPGRARRRADGAAARPP